MGPFEVDVPIVRSGIEERDSLCGIRIDTSERGPLMGVAVRTREGEVFRIVRSTRGTRDDVIDGKCRDLSAGRQMAVLAPGTGPAGNLSALRFGEGTHGRSANSG